MSFVLGVFPGQLNDLVVLQMLGYKKPIKICDVVILEARSIVVDAFVVYRQVRLL